MDVWNPLMVDEHVCVGPSKVHHCAGMLFAGLQELCSASEIGFRQMWQARLRRRHVVWLTVATGTAWEMERRNGECGVKGSTQPHNSC
jgi:hypothetical protein